MQYETTLWNPAADPNVWASDVYSVNPSGRRTRIHCGCGWASTSLAMTEASEFIEGYEQLRKAGNDDTTPMG